jgi:hypothetical protein
MFHDLLSSFCCLATIGILLLGMQRVSAEDLWLIPQPKELTRQEGALSLLPNGRIFLPQPVETPEFLAAQRLRDAIRSTTGFAYQLDRLGRDTQPRAGDIVLTVASTRPEDQIERDTYTLAIGDRVAEVHGHGAEGLFYGIQTLVQIVNQSGSSLPRLSITDSPDFPNRGVYHDVSRGKVPKLETLKWMVDYLSAMKVNQFQLYIEHPYMFRFNPAIAQNPDGLTAEEILELQKYCQDRRVLFVPSLQSFGHMAGVFALPEYRHLADVDLPGTWAEMTWNQRMHGATIDISNPEALEILKMMHDEYLPLFDAPFVNVCADETYDLGKGKTTALAEQRGGAGVLYLDHIKWLNELSKSYGKRMMFWGDIVKQHPTLVPEIPKDTILLNWGYSANTDFESCKLFADAGLDFYVCPGTSGWRRVMNDVNNADLNIRRYAEAGHRHGAIGLLNTDWGDHGHFNHLAGSLHGFALGASMSWNVNTPEQEQFDAAWNHQMFGSADRAVIQNMRDQSVPNGTWTAFFWPIEAEESLRSWYVIPEEGADQLIREGQNGVRLYESMLARGIGERWIVEELLNASRMNVLVGRRTHLRRAIVTNAGSPNGELAAELIVFARDVEAFFPEYERLWRNRSKESDLGDIRRWFVDVPRESREIAGRLHGS